MSGGLPLFFLELELAEDEKYTLELAEFLKSHFSKQKAMIRECRQLRALMHEVQVPEDYRKTTKVVRTPLLADMVQRVTATLTVNYPSWTRGLLGDRPSDEKDSSLIERWLVASHLRMESQIRRRVFRMLIDSAVADGMGVVHYRWNKEAWSPFPIRKKDEKGEHEEDADPYLKRVKKHVRERPFPFSWKDVDPLTYHFWDSYNDEREVVLIEEVPLAPTARALGVRYDGADRKWVDKNPGQAQEEGTVSGESVQLIQHWTKDTTRYLLDGKQAKEIKHGWGWLSFFDFAGLSTHERAPERAFLPVTFAFAQLVPFLDRLLTMKANWAYLASYPRGVLKLTAERLEKMTGLLPSAEQERAADVSKNLSEIGTLLMLYGDEDFSFASPPPVGDDLNQLIQLVMGLIQTTGLGPIMRGDAPGGDASGYLANQLMTAARLAYDPITDNARFMLRDGAAFLLYGVDKLAKTGVPVFGEGDKKGKAWLELSSKHIDSIYDTEPKLDPLLPSNLLAEGIFGLQQVQGGAISMYTHRERFLRIPNPEDEEKKVIIERVKASPRVYQMIEEQVARKAGLMFKPPDNPLAGLLGQGGEASPIPEELQGVMPRTPGIGMPIDQGMVQRQGPPVAPETDILPGVAPPPGQAGGQFGRQVVPNG